MASAHESTVGGSGHLILQQICSRILSVLVQPVFKDLARFTKIAETGGVLSSLGFVGSKDVSV